MIDGSTSDGYHTFDELYDHRVTLFITLCHFVRTHQFVWRSMTHSDGTSFEGWFLLGIGVESGRQITYHVPVSRWNETDFAQTRDAPPFDGHTSADVLKRLGDLRDLP
jgi:hypothetical protein